jgi:hypothetical protein
MNQAMFNYPPQAEFGRVLPKNKIYEYARPTTALKAKFVADIEQIVWQYKLSPETINLPARAGAPEIQIFGIALKTTELSESVLRCIDQSIPFPIFYQLSYGKKVKVVAAYKRPNEADASRWVVDAYFESAWLPADAERTALPVSLDLAGLYEQMLRQLMPEPPRTGESLKEQVERQVRIRSTQAEYRKMEARLQKEKQFNRKVELNAQLRSIKNELDELSS